MGAFRKKASLLQWQSIFEGEIALKLAYTVAYAGYRTGLGKADQPKEVDNGARCVGATTALVGELDHSPRQPCARKPRWSEGWRSPSLVRLYDNYYGGAVLSYSSPSGPRRGKAARIAGTARC